MRELLKGEHGLLPARQALPLALQDPICGYTLKLKLLYSYTCGFSYLDGFSKVKLPEKLIVKIYIYISFSLSEKEAHLAAVVVETPMPSPRKRMTFLACLTMGCLCTSLSSASWLPAFQNSWFSSSGG